MSTRFRSGRRQWKKGASWLALMVILGAACSGGNEQPAAEVQSGGKAASAAPVNLTGSENISDPEIALDGEGTIHVVWVEGLTSEAHVVHRFLRKGQGWSAPEILTEGYAYNGAPTLLAKPDGQLCVFWGATVPEAALYMRCWTNGSWSPTQKAVEPQGLTASYDPAFASDGTPVAVYSIPPGFVGFSGSEITPDGVLADGPALAVDSTGGFHATWRQFAGNTNELGGAVYRHSSDGGATWSPPELLRDRSIFTDPDLLADKQGNVHWLDLDGAYRRWTPTDGWSEVEVIDEVGLGRARLALDPDGHPRIVRPGIEGVYLAEQRPDGTWTEPTLVKATAGGPVDATVLAVDAGGDLHLVWLTAGDNSVLYYTALG